jgi:hypothetical protein
MPSNRDRRASEEPIGIVIARGPTEEKTPRLVAYIWGPAPEGSRTEPERATS